jgi:hypothetical protein
MILHLTGEGDRSLEEFTVKQKGDLLRDDLGLDLSLASGDGPARAK